MELPSLSLCTGFIVSFNRILKSLYNLWCNGDRLAIIAYLMFILAIITPLTCSPEEMNTLLLAPLRSRLRTSSLTLTSTFASLVLLRGLWFDLLWCRLRGVFRECLCFWSGRNRPGCIRLSLTLCFFSRYFDLVGLLWLRFDRRGSCRRKMTATVAY